MTKFNIGDKVTKFDGDYWFDGEVRSVTTKKSGAVRYDVENDAGLMHIFSEKQLRHVGNMADHQYLRVLNKLLMKGVHRPDRTGTGTYGLFGEQLRFDLSEGFPLLTTKKVHLKSIIVELLFFIKGITNIEYLKSHGVSIWDEWADADGNLGPVYGKQWRDFGGVDQLKNVIEGLKTDPYGRRHIVTAWNPAEIQDMALPPCHTMFQFHVSEGRLNCHLYQRSGDWFLGVPFNIASYALLTLLVAREIGLVPGEFIHSFGDLHLYANHLEQAREQIQREPLGLPTVLLNARDEVSIFDLEPEHVDLRGYKAWPSIKAEVSV